jgi:hypothetical protein
MVLTAAVLLVPVMVQAKPVPTVTINPHQRVQVDLCAVLSSGSTSCPITSGWRSPEELKSSSNVVSVRPVYGSSTVIEIDPLQEIFAPGLGKFTTSISVRASDGRGGVINRVVLKVCVDPAAPDDPFTIDVKTGNITVIPEPTPASAQ